MTPQTLNMNKNIFAYLRKSIAMAILVAFIGTSIKTPAYAQSAPSQLPWMPKAGTMVSLTAAYTPANLKGIVIHPDNALMFDFLIQRGQDVITDDQKKSEYNKLIKYFLASLAIPDDDQWVNLSPYEKDRTIKEDFGKTEMGRDLLAQDYILKQITASLIYPESSLGQKFWDKVYSQAQEQFGTSNVPMNTFNKVWIVPDEATIYEKGNTVYIVKQHLKVMLEQDYLSLSKHAGITSAQAGKDQETNKLGSQIVREIVLPALEKEVNEGKNFAALRQIYNGMLLATWYKQALKESLLGKIYADQSKVKGVNQPDTSANQEIYKQYVKAFKKGVFNYIKEDMDKFTNQAIPRKYFSGGMRNTYKNVIKKADPAMGARVLANDVSTLDSAVANLLADQESPQAVAGGDTAMVARVSKPEQAISSLDGSRVEKVRQLGNILSGSTIDVTYKPTVVFKSLLPSATDSRDFQDAPRWSSPWSKLPKGALNPTNMSDMYTKVLSNGLGAFTDRKRGVIAYTIKEANGYSVLSVFIQPHQSVPHIDQGRNAGAFLSVFLSPESGRTARQILREFPEALFYVFGQSSENIFKKIDAGFISVNGSKGFYGAVDLDNSSEIELTKRSMKLDTQSLETRAVIDEAKEQVAKDKANREAIRRSIDEIVRQVTGKVPSTYVSVLRRLQIMAQTDDQTTTAKLLGMLRLNTTEGILSFAKLLGDFGINPTRTSTWDSFARSVERTANDYLNTFASVMFPAEDVALSRKTFDSQWLAAIRFEVQGIVTDAAMTGVVEINDDSRFGESRMLPGDLVAVATKQVEAVVTRGAEAGTYIFEIPTWEYEAGKGGEISIIMPDNVFSEGDTVKINGSSFTVSPGKYLQVPLRVFNIKTSRTFTFDAGKVLDAGQDRDKFYFPVRIKDAAMAVQYLRIVNAYVNPNGVDADLYKRLDGKESSISFGAERISAIDALAGIRLLKDMIGRAKEDRHIIYEQQEELIARIKAGMEFKTWDADGMTDNPAAERELSQMERKIVDQAQLSGSSSASYPSILKEVGPTRIKKVVPSNRNWTARQLADAFREILSKEEDGELAVALFDGELVVGGWSITPQEILQQAESSSRDRAFELVGRAEGQSVQQYEDQLAKFSLAIENKYFVGASDYGVFVYRNGQKVEPVSEQTQAEPSLRDAPHMREFMEAKGDIRFSIAAPGQLTFNAPRPVSLPAKSAADRASVATEQPVGGIDLNAANLNLQIKRDGKGVPLPLSQQDMSQLSKIEGLIPVIMEIKPASLLPVFKDLNNNSPMPIPVNR